MLQECQMPNVECLMSNIGHRLFEIGHLNHDYKKTVQKVCKLGKIFRLDETAVIVSFGFWIGCIYSY